ncbi:M42 family peptidase [Segetibacter sp. 3557_3]|uniref:M42 family metallopeptidase n=1 Tax=Segetibacter sp. 3557_3 TaxID=2547429 RepID=UPI0010591399|nr:M42 family metallopeptidase [Segetibacter sp. 3557_3]TDH25589.1 M42 family peptidase [Segetibacter sp. 3557_3]
MSDNTQETTPDVPSILTETSHTFLRSYLNNASPVGFESSGQKLWLDYIRPFIHTELLDPYGTAVGIINPDHPFKVVIEAHADEISWFVNYVTDQGLIYLKRNGGVDHQIAPSMRVIVHGKKGPVKAVFGWPAIHTRLGNPDQKEQAPKVDNLFLDCGARNKKEVEDLGIHIGAVVTYEEGFDELAYNYYIGRAMDNRIGGFMIAEVARLLRENNVELPFGLYVVNAVQEEIGLRGAEMIARRIKPNIAIVTDVTHDTSTPMINKMIEGDCSCGKGPALCYAPAVHTKLLHFTEEVANNNSIPYQMRTLSRSTGTDTDSFAYANDGCPSVLISIPLRYMHTTVEMLHKSDVENTIRLMYETLLKITPEINLRYF